MVNKFIKDQEKLLIKQKKNLERDLLQVAKKKKTGEKYEPKFINFDQRDDESAYKVTTYEEYIALGRSLSKVMVEVNKALRRIEKGKYIYCESCKKEIEKNRLKAIPTTSQCLTCASKPKRRFRLAFWRK